MDLLERSDKWGCEDSERIRGNNFPRLKSEPLGHNEFVVPVTRDSIVCGNIRLFKSRMKYDRTDV